MIYQKIEGRWTKIESVSECVSTTEYAEIKNNRCVMYKNGRAIVSSQLSESRTMAEIERDEMVIPILEKIGLMNISAKTKDKLMLESSPRVGFFWIDTKAKKLYGVEELVKDAQVIGSGTEDRYVVHPSCHYETFPEIQRQNPKWKHKEYEDIPRGRVVLKTPKGGDPEYYVYMSPELNSPKFEELVKSYYGLPWFTIFDYSDEHYEIPSFS